MSSDGEQKQVKVFISSISANKEVKQQQQRVLQTLEVKRIPFETKDIAVDQDAKRDFRRLMRVHDPRAVTPQIFNGDTLCGNYEAFYWAVEEETLKVFLLLEAPPRKPPPPQQQQQQQGQPDSEQSVTSPSGADNASVEQTTHTEDDSHTPATPPPPPPPPPPPVLGTVTTGKQKVADDVATDAVSE